MNKRVIFDNWGMLLGEVEITDDDKKYILKVGYVKQYRMKMDMRDAHKILYIRLWDIIGNFMGAAWLPHLGSGNITLSTLDRLPKSLIDKCIYQAKRFEKLRVFA